MGVFSATYPKHLEDVLSNYMVEPALIRLNAEDVQLVGVKQYAVPCKGRDAIEVLLKLLRTLSFSQCLVFSNNQNRFGHLARSCAPEFI